MKLVPGYLLLMAFFYFSWDIIEAHEIKQKGPAWLGESLTLVIQMPSITRPIVWKSLNYKYECDRICADGTDYKVTHVGNTSTLWIRNVTRKFARWQVQDDNGDGAKLDLDIKVKPKIEIKNVSCTYKVKALCSAPRTSIECFKGKDSQGKADPLKSECNDNAVSTIKTLKLARFSGEVTCWFTIEKIFNESRSFVVDCEHVKPDPKCILTKWFTGLFHLPLLVGCILFFLTKAIVCVNILRVFGIVVYLIVSEVLVIIALVLCLKGKPDALVGILLAVAYALIFGWIIAAIVLWKKSQKNSLNTGPEPEKQAMKSNPET